MEEEKVLEKQDVQDTKEEESESEVGFDDLDEKTQRMIQKLRKENAKYRTKAKENSEWKEKAEEYDKKIEEEKMQKGEFEKLYAEAKEKLTTLDEVQAEKEKYDEYFHKQIDKEMDTLDDVHKDIINNLHVNLSQKLDYINKLKGQKKTVVVPNDRPGVGTSLNIDLQEYIGPKGRAKLIQIKKNDPKLYDRILQAKANK